MKIWKFVKKVLETNENSSNIFPSSEENQEAEQPSEKEEFEEKDNAELEESESLKETEEQQNQSSEHEGQVEQISNEVSEDQNLDGEQTQDNQSPASSSGESQSGLDQLSPSSNALSATDISTESELNHLQQSSQTTENNSELSESQTEEDIQQSIQQSNQNAEVPDKDVKEVVEDKVTEMSDANQEPQSPKEQLEELKEKLNEMQNNLQSSSAEEENKIEAEKTKENKKEKINPQSDSKEMEQSEEIPHELSEESNNFLNQLSELPSFEKRDRGTGYSIDTKSKTAIPESVVRTLITKFLNQRFCRKNSDLNIRSNSLEKSDGFYKWEVKDVIIHSKTHQLNKVLNDKYSYEYAEGQGDNVPLSFYFDMSGSMSSYTNMLATIAIELLKKNVKVLIGFNERVNVQINHVDKNITVEELAQILTSAGYSSWGYSNKNRFIKDSRVKFKYIDRNIDNYLIEKKAEKCVVFSDFDPISEVINLSQKVQTYWFCFEQSFNRSNLNQYNGFMYSVQNAEDILAGLVKVNEKRFETLCYVDNPKQLQKRRS